MTTSKVSNEMIYELLKRQHEDLRDLKTDMRRLEDKHDHMDQRLRRVETSIDGIRMTWSSRLVAGILGTSAVTSAFVAFVMMSIS